MRESPSPNRPRGRAGGRGGGAGYHFQDLYTALQLAKLLVDEDVEEVRWERKARDHGGDRGVELLSIDDLAIEHAGGGTTYVDVKSRAPGRGGWTVAKLAEAGVIEHFWRQWLSSGAEAAGISLRLATASPAEQLTALAEAARIAQTPAELEAETSAPALEWARTIGNHIEAPAKPLLAFLRTLDVENVVSEEELQKMIRRVLLPFGADATSLADRLVKLVARSRAPGRDARSWHTRTSLVAALLAEGVPEETLMRSGELIREWHGLPRLYVWSSRELVRLQATASHTLDALDAAPIDQEPITAALVREGRLPNLLCDFEQLGEAFEQWLTAGHRKRSEGLPVMWLLHEAEDQRKMGLMACMARATGHGCPVGDAGRNLALAVTALERSIFARPAPVSTVVGVDLREWAPVDRWEELEEILEDRSRRREADRLGRPVMLVVSGTLGQAHTASAILGAQIELEPIDTSGRPQARPYSYDGLSLPSERVYNRGLPITSRKLFGRTEELEELREAWRSPQTQVVSIVAAGGAGKSALVNDWLHELQSEGFPEAERVLIWSFYSQGTRENLVSADAFVSSALSWLGDEEAIRALNPAARGARLAALIREHKLLLVLDGLEPLQHPPKTRDVGGKLTDNSIRALLTGLAEPGWRGLCVLTTRVPPADLAPFEEGGGRGSGRVMRRDLDPLELQDGVELLRHLIGKHASTGELRKAVREVGRHALAVTLLGNYIREVEHGDLTRRVFLEKLTERPREGGHARRIMASYARWLSANERLGELAILHLIGLFDRPAEPKAMAALLADAESPQANGLDGAGTNGLGDISTNGLGDVGSETWDRCVQTLIEVGLLNKEVAGPPGSLDAHPLVREHFRDELKKQAQEQWTQGNRVLYEHYGARAPQQPATVAGMQPLYAAVTHGCAAGLYQEVFDELLLRRIWRDRRTNYSTRRLGMTGADTVALSNYFQSGQWARIGAVELTAPARVLLLTNAGVRLRQLGQLRDARESFSAVAREIDPLSAGAEDLDAASYGAAQYCELLVIAGCLRATAGQSDNALASARSAIEYADRGEDSYFAMHARSTLAEVHLMLGEPESAEECFSEAMRIELERGPNPPFLYSQGLFRYGYHLIELGRARELLDGAAESESWGTNGEDSSILSEAIRLLILGAARRSLVERGEGSPEATAEAEALLDASHHEFLNAGYADYTVRGLIERAHFHRIRGKRDGEQDDYLMALKDLREATYEAERGDMGLLYADILLQRAATHIDFWPELYASERAEAAQAIPGLLTEAEQLVSEFGYARHAGLLARLKQTAERLEPPITG